MGDFRADPAGALDHDERRRQVQEALATLSPPQRQAIELAYFEGLSQSEIAERLQEPLGTVKTRVRLGMQKLRECLRALLLRAWHMTGAGPDSPQDLAAAYALGALAADEARRFEAYSHVARRRAARWPSTARSRRCSRCRPRRPRRAPRLRERVLARVAEESCDTSAGARAAGVPRGRARRRPLAGARREPARWPWASARGSSPPGDG